MLRVLVFWSFSGWVSVFSTWNRGLWVHRGNEREKVGGKQNVKVTISGKRSFLKEQPWPIDFNTLLPGQHSRCLRGFRVAQKLLVQGYAATGA